MKTNYIVSLVLRIAAIVTAVIGLTTLIAPAAIISVFDGYNADNFHFVRFIGTALIGFAVMNWLYSTFEDMRVVLPVLYGNMTSLVLAIIVDLVGLLAGTLTQMTWFILGLHLMFVAAFGYCIRLVAINR